MTERKPTGMSFTSWIDQQINEAKQRGSFDNLPGSGKPLPNRGDEDAAQAWLREYVRREGIPPEDLLPTPLKLRKERERLAEAAAAGGGALHTEQDVRDACADLNNRIIEFRRFPSGPPIFVPLADEEDLVRMWRETQSELPSDPAPSAPQPVRRRRWRRR